MRSGLPIIAASAAAGVCLLWQSLETGAQVVVETGPEAEVTADGLYRVPPAVMPGTWAKPDLDLSRYSRIFFLPTIVQLREIPERRYSARAMANDTAFPINELRQERLRNLFGEHFYEAVSTVRSYELSDELGRDVLMIQGFLTDVASGVPPDNTTGFGAVIRMAWEVSLVMELRDAMSNELLARTIEAQRVTGPMDAGAVFSLTPRLTQQWSRRLVRNLEELSDLTGRSDVGRAPSQR